MHRSQGFGEPACADSKAVPSVSRAVACAATVAKLRHESRVRAAPRARRSRAVRTASRRAPGSRPTAPRRRSLADAYAVIATAGIVPPAAAGRAPQAANQRVAVLVRHAHVAQQRRRARARSIACMRLGGARRDRHVGAVLRQRRVEQHPRVLLVVHHQDADVAQHLVVHGRRRQRGGRNGLARAPSPGCAATIDGRKISNVAPAPRPRALRLRSCRRAARSSCLAMARPRPRPPCSRLAVPSACRNASNTCGRNRGSIPGPESRTVRR